MTSNNNSPKTRASLLAARSSAHKEPKTTTKILVALQTSPNHWFSSTELMHRLAISREATNRALMVLTDEGKILRRPCKASPRTNEYKLSDSTQAYLPTPTDKEG